MKFSFIITAIFLVFLFSVCFSTTSYVYTSPSTKCDPGMNTQFTTIQEAVYGSSAGDTIIVCKSPSVYSENILVNVSVNIYGNESGVAINSNDNSNPVFTVNSNYVNISNFFLRYSYSNGGILINSNHSTVNNVSITYSNIGVFVSSSNYNTVSNSSFRDNSHGILAQYATFTILDNLNSTSNGYGYRLQYGDNNSLTNSYALDNDYAVFVQGTSNNNISNNTLEESNIYDFMLDIQGTLDFCNNIISNNIGSGGRPINYTNETVNWNNIVASEIFLCNAPNSILENVTVSGSFSKQNNMVYLINSDNTNITNSFSSDNEIGFMLKSNNFLQVLNNTGNNNDQDGIVLESSSYGTYMGNSANSNDASGFFVNELHNSNFSSNTANGNNDYGFILTTSANNNLTGNIMQENDDLDLYVAPQSAGYCNNIIEDTLGSGDRPINYSNSQVNWDNIVASEIILCNADNSILTNVTVAGSDSDQNNGIIYLNMDNSTITNFVSNNNFYGIYVMYSTNNTLINGTTNNELSHGFFIESSSNISLINGTVENSDFGVLLYGASFTNLTNYAVSGNNIGIFISNGNSNILTHSTSNFNNYYGILIEGGNLNNVSNVTANNNINGIMVQSNSGNLFNNNTANNNLEHGFIGQDIFETVLNNSVLTENGQYDFYIDPSGDPTNCNNIVENTNGSRNRPIYYANSSVSWNNLDLSEMFLCNADGASINNVSINGSDSIKNNAVVLIFTDNANINNTQSPNNYYGYYLVSNNNNNNISNSFTELNDQMGFRLQDESESNNFVNDTSQNNSYNFYVQSSASNTFTNSKSYFAGNPGFYIASSDSVILTNVISNSNGDHGISFASSNDFQIINATTDRNTNYGIYVLSSNFGTIANGTSTNNNVGILINSGGGSIITNNNASDNSWGIYLDSSSSNQISDNRVYNNNNEGIYIYRSDEAELSNNHYYNNEPDFEVNIISSADISLVNEIFDNPSGNLQNFTNLSITDHISESAYSISWTNQPTTPPTNLTSFARKYINIVEVTDPVSIDSISWYWSDSELTGYNETNFKLYQYEAGWNLLSDAPDTVANSLSISDLDEFGVFGILDGIIGPPFPPVYGNSDISNLSEWRMYSRYLNHNSSDGIDYSVISGLNQANYTTSEEIETSAAVANGYVYVANDAGDLYQFSATNVSQLINTFSIGTSFSYSNPTVVNGYVYIGSDDFNLYQLNATTLELINIFTTDMGYIESAPIVANGYVYIGSSDDNLYQLDATNISQEIAHFTSGSNIYSSAAVAGDYVYIGSNDDKIYQLNASNVSQEIAHFVTDNDVVSSPVIANGFLYVGSDDHYVYQLNASNINGTEGDPSTYYARFETGNYVTSSPAVADGYVYIAGYDNFIYQLDASNINGTYSEPDTFIASYETTDSLSSSPTIAYGYLYIGDFDGNLLQLDASNISQLVNVFTTGDYIDATPSVSNGYVYIGSGNTVFYQLKALNISLPNEFTSPPATLPETGGSGSSSKIFSIQFTNTSKVSCPTNLIGITARSVDGPVSEITVRLIAYNPYRGIISEKTTDIDGKATFDLSNELAGKYELMPNSKIGYLDANDLLFDFTPCEKAGLLTTTPIPIPNQLPNTSVTPTIPSSPTPTTTPETPVTTQPPETNTLPTDLHKDNANTAIADAKAEILSAIQSGRNAAEAQQMLEQANAALAAGDFDGAIKLAQNAKQLAQNAAANSVPQNVKDSKVKSDSPSSASTPVPQSNFIWIVVLGVVIFAIGGSLFYFFVNKRRKKKE